MTMSQFSSKIRTMCDDSCKWLEKKFHSIIVPFLHALLWFLAILVSEVLGRYLVSCPEKNQALVQLIPILIVFLFELSISLFDIFSTKTPSFINIKFMKYVALFIFLVGFTIIPLFLCYLFNIEWLYRIALFLAVTLKCMEMWLINNFNQYEYDEAGTHIGKALKIKGVESGYSDSPDE